MLTNYLKTGIRKLAKQRDFTVLNVTGLGISVACCMLIFTLLQYHVSVDTYHRKSDRIFRVVMDVKTDHFFPFRGVPTPMAGALRTECPLVENAAMRSAESEVLISVPGKSGDLEKYKELEKFAWVEPAYFDILDLPLLSGDVTSLKEPNTVVLSEKFARKYFNTADAIGKTLKQNNIHELRVVGVLKDLPRNTDYKHEILGSWATLRTDPAQARDLDSWNGARGENYCLALLKPGHQLSEMDAVMADFSKRHPHGEMPDLFTYKVKAMNGLHFDTDYGFGMDKKYLWALGLIGLFLLITACVNFVNMATAQALTRAREVGVRKSLGSTRAQLFWQFIFETGLIVATSLVTGFLLARLALPYLNSWLKENLEFDATVLTALGLFGLVLGVLLTFLAGSYPGLMQSRFNPVISMKGDSGLLTGGSFPLRRVLVTTQFFISQVLIIGAAVITAQMQFAQDADWGFRQGTIVTLDVPEHDKMNSLRQQLAQISGVEQVSLCYQPPASESNNHNGISYDHRPEPEPWFVSNKPADAHYIETFGLELVAGRNLTESDSLREVLVNETFVKKLNLSSPDAVVNKTVQIDGKDIPIVGVIRDFHNLSLSEAISPIIAGSESGNYTTCAVRLREGNPTAVLDQVRQVWQSQFPNHFYEYKFMDERLQQFFETENMLLRLIRTFAGIAILIGCLGLYGLAAFMISRKRKEVGIRKTLGAGVPGILWLFGKEYVRLIVVAFILAAPVAWWVMDGWLKDYVYRISIGVGVFLISLFVTCFIAVLTVGLQSIKAALANPVHSLRSE